MSARNMAASAEARYDVTVEDVEFLRHGGQTLLARLYLPIGSGPRPLVAEIHGGAWCRGNRLDDESMNRALAERGVAVAALDFRMPPGDGYPASIADINYGVRWLKSQAFRLGSRPEWVSLMGVSSGGHQAMLAAMRPHDPRYASIPLPDEDATDSKYDATVSRVVMGWPVIDPLGRYEYAMEWKASGQPYPEAIDRVIPDHLRYWRDTRNMAEGSPIRVLESGTEVHTPTVLCVQGSGDQIHPRAHLERFAAAWQKAGGSFTLRWFNNEIEGFIVKKPASPATSEALNKIVQFLNAGLYETAHL